MTDIELSKNRMSEDCPILNSLIEGAKIHSSNALIMSKLLATEESLERCNWNGTYFECSHEDATNIKM